MGTGVGIREHNTQLACWMEHRDNRVGGNTPAKEGGISRLQPRRRWRLLCPPMTHKQGWAQARAQAHARPRRSLHSRLHSPSVYTHGKGDLPLQSSSWGQL